MEKVESQKSKQQQPIAPEAPALPPIKDEIDYDTFAKLDLRLAKVVACEEVKRSKKLLKLTVSLGSEQRTVVSGIKNWYKPENLVGKTVVLVANLKPVTLCGVESHGMILCASDPEDKELAFVTPAAPLTEGWVVR
jgi:methionyl-tRNA synthetase